MGWGSLRRYDVQARYAVATAAVSIVPLLAGAYLALRNYRDDVRQIVYQANSYALALVACIGASILLGGTACVFGFNSAGQRINDRPGWSWTGFFLGGAVATAGLILFLTFMMLRLKKVS